MRMMILGVAASTIETTTTATATTFMKTTTSTTTSNDIRIMDQWTDTLNGSSLNHSLFSFNKENDLEKERMWVPLLFLVPTLTGEVSGSLPSINLPSGFRVILKSQKVIRMLLRVISSECLTCPHLMVHCYSHPVN